MKAEREKIHAKVKADTVRLNGSKLELTADEETCTFLPASSRSMHSASSSSRGLPRRSLPKKTIVSAVIMRSSGAQSAAAASHFFFAI